MLQKSKGKLQHIGWLDQIQSFFCSERQSVCMRSLVIVGNCCQTTTA